MSRILPKRPLTNREQKKLSTAILTKKEYHERLGKLNKQRAKIIFEKEELDYLKAKVKEEILKETINIRLRDITEKEQKELMNKINYFAISRKKSGINGTMYNEMLRNILKEMKNIQDNKLREYLLTKFTLTK
ncbi:MAG: hypothetical protein WCF78_00030 [archaeon]